MVRRARLVKLIHDLASLESRDQLDGFFSSHPDVASFDARIVVIDLADVAFRERRRNDVKVLNAIREEIEKRLAAAGGPNSPRFDAEKFEDKAEFDSAFAGLVRLAGAPTLSEARRDLDKDPLLLSDATLALLSDMTENATRSAAPDVAARFTEILALLRRCRQVGVRAACTEKVYKDDEQFPPIDAVFGGDRARIEETLAHLQEVAIAETAKDAVAVLQRNPDLLSDEADSLLRHFIRTQREGGQGKVAELFVQAYDFLADFRDQRGAARSTDGQIAAALDEAEVSPEQAMALFQQAQEGNDEDGEMKWGEACLAKLGDRLTDRSKAALATRVANLLMRRSSSDDPSAVDRAVRLYEVALAFNTQESDPQNWASLQHNLGVALAASAHRGGSGTSAAAMEHVGAALTVLTREAAPGEWARAQLTLGNILSERPDNRPANLELALDHYLLADEGMRAGEDQTAYGQLQLNLAMTYLDRLAGDRAENIEQAIVRAQAALEMFSREEQPANWFGATHVLAQSYSERIRGSAGENREQSIRYFQQALTVEPPTITRLEWGQAQNSLGWVYNIRRRGSRPDNSERAIEHISRALTVHDRATFPEEFARDSSNLALVYQNRTLEGVPSNRDLALAHTRDALTVYTEDAYPEHFARVHCNLALILLTTRGPAPATDAQAAIVACQNALRVLDQNAPSAEYRRALEQLGDAHMELGQWEAAAKTYAAAAVAALALFRGAYTEDGRRAASAWISEARLKEAFADARRGRWSDALSALEASKARFLIEQLQFAERLGRASAEQQRSLAELRKEVNALEAAMASGVRAVSSLTERRLAAEMKGKRAALASQLAEIDAADPHHAAGDGAGPAVADILAAAPAGGALIAPLVTRWGALVFVIPGGTEIVTEAHALWLDDVDQSAVDRLVRGQPKRDELGLWLRAVQGGSPEVWQHAIEEVVRDLGTTVGEPISARLTKLGVPRGAPVVVLPQGDLVLLPLHAATIDGEPFSHVYELHYAPSAEVSRQARARAARSMATGGLLLVGDPTEDLAFAHAEAEAISSRFARERVVAISGPAATLEAVKGALTGQRWLHFCCHGHHAWGNPGLSGLLLAGGQVLTVSEIATSVDLSDCRLAMLSACETGIVDIGIAADEHFGLPSAFLQAGASAVISALWPVQDLATMLLMDAFYERYLTDLAGPAAALRDAQRWLATLTNSDIAKLFRARAENAPDRPRMPYALARQQVRNFAADAPSKRPFAHPYFWAGFSVTGW